MTVTLALVEILLRLFLPLAAGEDLRGLHVVRPDRPWLYGLRPGARSRLRVSGGVRYEINPDGFRDRLHVRRKPPGTFRIVVMGDSIAFGYGIALEDAFPKVLERHLTTLMPEPSVEVLDLGVSGYNPYTEAALLADVGVGYQPDLVLVQFCINDLNDPTLHFDAATMDVLGPLPDAAYPDPAHRARPPTRGGRLGRACRRLRTCSLIADALTRPRLDPALLAAIAPHENPSPQELDWLRARYDDMDRTAAGVGAKLVVIVFPWESQMKTSGPGRVEDAIVALGRQAGWEVVDLLPAFRRAAAAGDGPLFFDLWHPTAAGHRVAAAALAAQLACRGLVPAAGAGGCDAP